MRLKARKSFRYSSRQLEVGDEFEANTRDARMFVLLGKAEVPKAEEEKKPAHVEHEEPVLELPRAKTQHHEGDHPPRSRR